MRKVIFIAALMLAAIMGGDLALAQGRVINMAPKMAPKMAKPPIILMIPPSAALSAAARSVPGAKAIGVKLRGNVYIVKLKQGNTILQKRIVAGNGAVLP